MKLQERLERLKIDIYAKIKAMLPDGEVIRCNEEDNDDFFVGGWGFVSGSGGDRIDKISNTSQGIILESEFGDRCTLYELPTEDLLTVIDFINANKNQTA